jgi:hypothetical protein
MMNANDDREMRRLWRLKRAVTVREPHAWQFHRRWALLAGGEELATLQPGTWLLDLGAHELPRGDGTRLSEHLYRLASGQVVALDNALGGEDVEEVGEPQAVTAMNAYRSLEEAIYEDLGLTLECEQPGVPPFGLVRCPVCGHFEFASLDLATVYCQACLGTFRIRSTAGDPGFVLDCFVQHVHLLAARYLIPKVDCLSFHMVWKGGGDARDLRHDPEGVCRSAARQGKCKPEAPWLTGEDAPTLRPALHACYVDTVYPWQLSGEIPTPRMVRHLGMWQVDGQLWPRCASLERRVLDVWEARRVRRAAGVLRRLEDREAQEAAHLLDRLSAIPQGAAEPVVWIRQFPPLSELGPGEQYMLHHWLLQPGTPDSTHSMAHPAWYVVKAVLQAGRLETWQVVRKDICPACGRRVLPGQEQEKHARCQEVWAETGWQPPAGKNQADDADLPPL